MNTIKGTFTMGIKASKGISPLPKPSKPPIPEIVVHVIRVANPKPDVGITNGRETRSSRKSLPKNFLRAST